jgi:arginine-tRNA-protein transferase
MVPEGSIRDGFESVQVRPEEMDVLWSLGFRHFGTYFFRYDMCRYKNETVHVLPLRIDLKRFTPSASQKRIMKRNRDLRVVFREAFIDEEKIRLFEMHRERFTENIPDNLFTFISPMPSIIPCRTLECCLFHEDKLIAAGFMDIGETSTSAVYTVYDTGYYRRSLGIYVLLSEIRYSTEAGFDYLYHGYTYREDSNYEYKKNFTGLEYFDWRGEWKPMPRNSHSEKGQRKVF